MKKHLISRKDVLYSLENIVETQIRQAVTTFQNLDETTLLESSNTGGWSIAECLEHLNTYSRFYLPQIKNKLKTAPPSIEDETFKGSFLGNYFVDMMETESSVKKYKAAKKHLPAKVQYPYQVAAEFIQHQENLLILIRNAVQKDTKCLAINTSLHNWIKLNIIDAFRFLVAHNKRHIKQAMRNIQ